MSTTLERHYIVKHFSLVSYSLDLIFQNTCYTWMGRDTSKVKLLESIALRQSSGCQNYTPYLDFSTHVILWFLYVMNIISPLYYFFFLKSCVFIYNHACLCNLNYHCYEFYNIRKAISNCNHVKTA